MPSQRKKGLKLVGAFVPESEYKKIKAEAKKRKMTLADYVREKISEHLKKEK